MEDQTANQLFKQSNTSLAFKDWIAREKDKGIFIKNQLLNEITNPVLENKDNVLKAKFDIGVPKLIIYSGIAILILAVIYNNYKK